MYKSITKTINNKLITSEFFWILVITFLAFFLRIMGTDPGYPNFHPDEGTISDSMLRIMFNLDFFPLGYYYGALLPILYALFNITILLPNLFNQTYLPNISDTLFRIREYSNCINIHPQAVQYCLQNTYHHLWDYLARYDSAFFSSLTVVAVFLLAKKLFNKNVGIMASLFVAVNYRHVLSSILSLADAPTALFAILSIFLSTRLIINNKAKDYIFAGIGFGLALSTKYFYYVFPTFLVCHGISVFKTKGLTLLQKLKAFLGRNLILTILISAVVFLALNPYLIFDYQRAFYQFDINARRYGLVAPSLSSVTASLSNIYLFQFFYLYRYGLGPLLSLLTLVSLIYTLFRRPKAFFIILSTLGPFFLFFSTLTGSVNVRNYSSIIPLLLIFPAFFVADTFAGIKKVLKIKGNKVNIILAAMVALIISGNLKNSFILTSEFSKVNNYQNAIGWIHDNIPDNARILKSAYTYPPPDKPYKIVDLSLNPKGYISVEEIQEKGFQWVLISSDSNGYINNPRWIDKNYLVKKFLKDQELMWDFMSDTYTNLLTQELYNYALTQFIKKPGSLDPAYFIAKVPEKVTVGEKTFISFSSLNDWSRSGRCIEYYDEKKNSLSTAEKNNLEPTESSKFYSPSFKITESKGYAVKARIKFNSTKNITKSDFFRIDFYAHDDKKLKTFVSGLIPNTNAWTLVSLTAVAPKNSDYARVALQSDECLESGEYSVQWINIYETQEPIKAKYPYFDKSMPNDFLWMPPL